MRLIRRWLATMVVVALVIGSTGTSVTAESPPLGPPAYAPPLPLGMAGVHGEVTRIYRAVLDRDPDPDGLRYWADQRQAGQSLHSVVAFFRTSPEFEDRFGALLDASDGEWVDLLYDRVLGRAADVGGRAFWVDRLATGQATKEDLIVHFAESREFQIATGTGFAGFRHLVGQSAESYAELGHDYRYQVFRNSFWSADLTILTVRDGVVVERSYERVSHIADDESWTETGAEVGTHTGAAPALTIEGVHEECERLLVTLDPWDHELIVEVDDDGRLTACGGLVLYIADVLHELVQIDEFEVLD